MQTRRTFLSTGAAGAAGLVAATTWPARDAGAAQAPLAAQDALRLAEGRRAELVDLLSRLVTVSSPLGESAAEGQQMVADYLRTRGYAPDLVVDDPTRYA